MDKIVYALARASFTKKYKAYSHWAWGRVTNKANEMVDEYNDRYKSMMFHAMGHVAEAKEARRLSSWRNSVNRGLAEENKELDERCQKGVLTAFGEMLARVVLTQKAGALSELKAGSGGGLTREGVVKRLAASLGKKRLGALVLWHAEG
jgi:hypothetical protein